MPSTAGFAWISRFAASRRVRGSVLITLEYRAEEPARYVAVRVKVLMRGRDQRRVDRGEAVAGQVEGVSAACRPAPPG